MAREINEIEFVLRDKVSRQMPRLRKSLDITSSLKGNIIALDSLINLTQKLARVLTPILSTFGRFERSMNRVRVLTGATGKQFDALTNKAKELGRTTQFTATQSAEALGFLAQAGFTANDALKALPRTLELAGAAQIDMARAADIVTNILTGLQIPIEELARANDVLVKTFISSNTNLEQLGEAFKFVAPLMKATNIEIEEGAAVLGLLGNAGIQASLAGTSFRRAIANLILPSKEASKTLARLGIQTKDSGGDLLSFTGIIEQLEDASASAEDILAIFGLRAGPAMAALVSQGSDKLKEFTKELQNAGGTAKRVSEAQLQGLLGAFTKMKSAIEGVVLGIGRTLSPAFIKLGDFVRDVAEDIGKTLQDSIELFIETIKRSKDGLKGFRDVLREIFKETIAGFNQIGTDSENLLNFVIKGFGNFLKIMVRLKVAVIFIVESFKILKSTIQLIFNTFVIFVSKIQETVLTFQATISDIIAFLPKKLIGLMQDILVKIIGFVRSAIVKLSKIPGFDKVFGDQVDKTIAALNSAELSIIKFSSKAKTLLGAPANAIRDLAEEFRLTGEAAKMNLIDNADDIVNSANKIKESGINAAAELAKINTIQENLAFNINRTNTEMKEQARLQEEIASLKLFAPEQVEFPVGLEGDFLLDTGETEIEKLRREQEEKAILISEFRAMEEENAKLHVDKVVAQLNRRKKADFAIVNSLGAAFGEMARARSFDLRSLGLWVVRTIASQIRVAGVQLQSNAIVLKGKAALEATQASAFAAAAAASAAFDPVGSLIFAAKAAGHSAAAAGLGAAATSAGILGTALIAGSQIAGGFAEGAITAGGQQSAGGGGFLGGQSRFGIGSRPEPITGGERPEDMRSRNVQVIFEVEGNLIATEEFKEEMAEFIAERVRDGATITTQTA